MLNVILFIAYLVLGLFQMAAVIAGLEDWLGFHWLIALPLAFFLAYIPLIGTGLGIAGAITAWGWTWIQACALFFGPFVVILIFAFISAMLDKKH